MFDKPDEELYKQMSDHPKSIIIKSKVPDSNGRQKQFEYLYVDDKKYMLGEGSFGRVFICFHCSQDRLIKLALKIIQIPEAYEQIKTIEHIVSTSRQQILALIKLRQNKHIIRIEDIIRKKNIIYIMLEFCNERDLVYYFNKLRKQNIIDKELIVRYYFGQILDAFKELYKFNFMHRDIKPSNILVKNGVLKVADFGLARQIIQGQRGLFEEHVGTMITAAPQIVFKEEYTSKCDIYSLGVILYWMIYNRFPYEKVPIRQDYLQNKLRIPEVGPNFVVSTEMQKLLKQMLSYNETQRIDWIPLLQHPLFDSNNFIQLDKKIRQHYENLQILKNRQTYGRHFVSHVFNDDQFLETTIPTSYYKFLKQIQGEEKFNRCLLEERNSFKENPHLLAHKKIKDEYKNQDIRIKFYRSLLIELENFQIQKLLKKNKQQAILIRTLLLFSIQKYLIYLMTKIKDELIFTIPPTIFSIHSLKQAEEQPLHRNFVETLIQKVRGNEFTITNKYSEQDIKRIQAKCQQFKIWQQVSIFFQQINERNCALFLNQIDQCIIELVYFIKPELNKLRNTLSKSNITNNASIGSLTKNGLFRSLILLCHHLFMFSMQDQIFPQHYDKQFPYNTFLETELFKVDRNIKILAENVWDMLARFQ